MPEGIDKIIVKNFKAFPEKEEIILNGTHPENLLNVFTDSEYAYIKVSLTAEPEVFYVLDRTGVHAEGESHNPDDVIVGLNNSSDFISHRLLGNGNIELKRVSSGYTDKIQDFNNDFYETHFQSDSEKKLQIKLELIENLRYEFTKQIRKVDNSEFKFESKDIQYPFIKLSISIEKDDGSFKPIESTSRYTN